jgi:hypothetical protein
MTARRQQREAALAHLGYKQECCAHTATAEEGRQQAAATQAKALADKANKQRRAATRDKTLSDKANEQRCHEAATRAKALADETTKQCHHEAATREKPWADEANEQRQAATLETALAKEANKQHCHVTAVQEDVLANVADEQRCQELAERAAVLAKSALATEQATVSADLVLPKPTRTADERFMAPVLPPNPVDTAIRRIWADCTLRAAPLDTILAKIASDDIAHEAGAPPTTTLPHPAAMLSTPPPPAL